MNLDVAIELIAFSSRSTLPATALHAAIPNRRAASALAELVSQRRSCERIAEALVRWSRKK